MRGVFSKLYLLPSFIFSSSWCRGSTADCYCGTRGLSFNILPYESDSYTVKSLKIGTSEISTAVIQKFEKYGNGSIWLLQGLFAGSSILVPILFTKQRMEVGQNHTLLHAFSFSEN